MNLYEEHALLKVLNKLYPETKDMTIKELIIYFEAKFLLEKTPVSKTKGTEGINEVFKTAVTRFTASSGV